MKNREILFRAKRTDNGEWVYGTGFTDFLNLLPEKRGHCWLWIIFEYPDGEGRGWVEVDRKTLCEFIGRTDAKGVKIFEGDVMADGGIVEYFNDLAHDGGAAIHPGFYCKEWFESDHDTSYYESGFKACEVMGNVHDNPGLSEGLRAE